VISVYQNTDDCYIVVIDDIGCLYVGSWYDKAGQPYSWLDGEKVFEYMAADRKALVERNAWGEPIYTSEVN
jgi:hypothetical protein